MTNAGDRKKLGDLYLAHTGVAPDSVTSLRGDGSDRRLYRLSGAASGDGTQSMIGVAHENRRENDSFVALSRHFRERSLPVPEIYVYDADAHIYLEEDLGETTLADWLARAKGADDERRELLDSVVSWLPRFQIEGAAGLEDDMFSSHPRFLPETAEADLDYFRDSFLGLLYDGEWDEAKLGRDCDELVRRLADSDSDFFLYRDFQARNMMVREGALSFIDYQSGRRGPLAYDLASFLYSSTTHFSARERNERIDLYVREASRLTQFDETRFRESFPLVALIRNLQTLGAYGNLGVRKGKALFLRNVPAKVNTIVGLFREAGLRDTFPSIYDTLARIGRSPREALKGKHMTDEMLVEIHSFSYHKSGIPRDERGHGGGFVFDCRFLPNPGREEGYDTLDGRDSEVRVYLEKRSEVEAFWVHVRSIVEEAVRAYEKRGFQSLSIAFGCTGGQHRSVYFAERLFAHLSREGKMCRLRHDDLPEDAD
ncbi:MAG: phosphotransferase [Gemmatimonadetes bacterium]|nr:phosphotransferase [Gemmatimonadota bacterium]